MKMAAAAMLCLVAFFAPKAGVRAADIHVLAGAAFSSALSELGARFERATGNKLQVHYGIAEPMKQALDDGEPFDVAILDAALLTYAGKKGRLSASPAIEVARVGMAVAIRQGTGKPDVSSVESFKKLLLDANSITYPPQGMVGHQLAQIIARFGIEDRVKGKTKFQKSVAAVPLAVAAGAAQVGFAPNTVLTAAKGIEIAGPFPAELQIYIEYAAAMSATSAHPSDSAALIKFLTSAEAISLLRSKGFEVRDNSKSG